jgi:serine/threonine protein kinase
MKYVLLGLEYVHKNGGIHRDVKVGTCMHCSCMGVGALFWRVVPECRAPGCWDAPAWSHVHSQPILLPACSIVLRQQHNRHCPVVLVCV